ncbi:uncharacterized protein LOC143603984 [Bidens hawaiensis]|uniref:uncharacterized protein LOC143603984 n=1 Tax=Bidens hawaiensis TaxID=980011 RepID=UPI00404A6C7A
MKRCSESEVQPERKYSKTLELLEWDHLWKQAPVFPVGAKFADPRVLSKHNWKFSKLQDAFKEGGLLHGKENVYLITVGESQGLILDGRPTKTYGPVVIAIVSPFPPSNKMAIIAVKEGFPSAKVIDMEKMNMAWVPCSIPLGQQATSDVGIELGPGSHFCLPCVYNLAMFFKPDQTINQTFYLFTGQTEFKNLANQTGSVSDSRSKKVEPAIQALEESRRTDRKVAAFENMRFYKFYPDFAVFKV